MAFELLTNISSWSKNYENSIDPVLRRQTGSYYTRLDLAEHIIDRLFDSFDGEFIKKISNKTFLEPCVGTGSFVFAYLKKVHSLELSAADNRKIIDNIYVCDINQEALKLYKSMFTEFVQTYFDIIVDESYFEHRVATALLFDLNSSVLQYIDLSMAFGCKGLTFDIVATNPPYKNLKAEKNKYPSDNEYNKDKELYANISTISKTLFTYSSDGVLNIYKMFVEEIICRYTDKDSYVALLIPSAMLTDKTCQKLRTHMLTNFAITSIDLIRENNPFIDAQQTLCAMIIDKSKKTSNIDICSDYCSNPNNYAKINISNILNEDTGNAIFSLGATEYGLLSMLRKHPTVKSLDFITNMRGELDLTANKQSIIHEKTLYKVLRGRNIGLYNLADTDSLEFASVEFVNKSSKARFVHTERLACQQVVNIHKEKRVKFSYVPKDHVLGNSCNFISVEENKYGIDIFFLLGLFNSSIINWYFKLTSSNNHVNNYEIDNFPIPVSTPHIKEISSLAQKYIAEQSVELLEKIEVLAYKAFGLWQHGANDKPMVMGNLCERYVNDMTYLIEDFSFTDGQKILNGEMQISTVFNRLSMQLGEFDRKTCEQITDKYIKISQNKVLNHTTFKLSDLDLEMVRTVPQGGNWKDIPSSIVKKSKRLERITQTGGRTTLYGRIDYNKPSYTITTYFSRPGNGTYIHPIHDRVLSVREAARLQSFKDDYYFYGNKSDLLNQVGNAVPPILAYHIAKKIIEKTGCKTTVDLFCGAGGLTAGFKEAGMKSILGNDIDKSACITFKTNNPEITTLCDDITDLVVKQKIIDAAILNGAGIICGGPPCQGFSHAGKRFIDDPRNRLFKDFVDVVEAVKPLVVVAENVEGILTFNGGAAYRDVISLFEELGYRVEGRKVMSNEYGVPQKRKRVIIICTRSDLNIMPQALFPTPTTLNEFTQITSFDAISDLENLPCDESATYSTKEDKSDYIKIMKSLLPLGTNVSPYNGRKENSEVYMQLSLF